MTCQLVKAVRRGMLVTSNENLSKIPVSKTKNKRSPRTSRSRDDPSQTETFWKVNPIYPSVVCGRSLTSGVWMGNGFLRPLQSPGFLSVDLNCGAPACRDLAQTNSTVFA